MTGWPGVRVAGWPGGRVAGRPDDQVAGWPGKRVAGCPGGRVDGRNGGEAERWGGAFELKKIHGAKEVSQNGVPFWSPFLEILASKTGAILGEPEQPQ